MGRPHKGAGLKQKSAFFNILACAPYIGAGLFRLQDADRGPVVAGVFLHDDRIGPSRNGRAGHNAQGLARLQSALWRV